MPVRNETAFSTDFTRLCGKCGLKELRRKPRSWVDRALSLQPYQCSRCANYVRKFRFTAVAVLVALFIPLAVGAFIYIQENTLWFHKDPDAQSSTDGLARARTATGGQLSPFEQMMLHKPKAVLDNATILKLVKANVEAVVILQMIKTSTADYDLSANAIIELKQAGVDEHIILAMIDASYNSNPR